MTGVQVLCVAIARKGDDAWLTHCGVVLTGANIAIERDYVNCADCVSRFWHCDDDQQRA